MAHTSARLCVVLAMVTVVVPLRSGRAAGGGTCQTGSGLFDYGPHRDNVEAEQLAMKLSGELRAPDDVYDRILRDLQLIRQSYPFLESAIDRFQWVPDQLTVGLEMTGTWPEYEALNAYYQVTNEEVILVDPPLNIIVLTYCDTINAVALAQEYEAVPGVGFARSEYNIRPTIITVSVAGDTYHYRYENWSGDCPSGCFCFRIWEIDVSLPGVVTLQSYEDNSPCFEIENITCCMPGGACTVTDMATCLANDGTPLAVGAPCTDCEIPVPVVSEWGFVISALLLVVAGTILTAKRPEAWCRTPVSPR